MLFCHIVRWAYWWVSGRFVHDQPILTVRAPIDEANAISSIQNYGKYDITNMISYSDNGRYTSWCVCVCISAKRRVYFYSQLVSFMKDFVPLLCGEAILKSKDMMGVSLGCYEHRPSISFKWLWKIQSQHFLFLCFVFAWITSISIESNRNQC